MKNYLEIKINNKLSFEEHVSDVSQKLHAVSRVAIYMKPLHRRIIMRAFVFKQFDYRPLVWMFHSRKSNHRTKEHSVLSIVITCLRSRNSKHSHFSLSPAIMGQILPLKKSRIYSSKHIFKSSNIRTTV